MAKITPISSIQHIRNNKRKKPTKEDFKRLLNKPPDDIA